MGGFNKCGRSQPPRPCVKGCNFIKVYISMARIKIYTGRYVICQCVGKGKKRRCKPKGQAYKFAEYRYADIAKTPATNLSEGSNASK